MGWLKAIGAIFGVIGKWLEGSQRAEDKKTGARQVENQQMKEGLDAAKEAKRVRKDNPKRTKSEHLDRV